MSKAVFCISTSDAQTEGIIGGLKGRGLSHQDISILLPDKVGAKHFASGGGSGESADAEAGAESGGVLGGRLGWLAGAGVLALPGQGAFVAAGPLMTALGGAAMSPAAGGIAGVLGGMGIPEAEAAAYTDRIRAGSALIAVHSETTLAAQKALDVFEEHQAEDISIASEEPAERSFESGRRKWDNYRQESGSPHPDKW